MAEIVQDETTALAMRPVLILLFAVMNISDVCTSLKNLARIFVMYHIVRPKKAPRQTHIPYPAPCGRTAGTDDCEDIVKVVEQSSR